MSSTKKTTLMGLDDNAKKERDEKLEAEERRAKLEADERKKKEYLEKQNMLNAIEAPLLALLDRLGVREDLAFPLAQNAVHTLEKLRACDHLSLARTLSVEYAQAPFMEGRPSTWMEDTLAKAVDMARRDIAMQKINVLMLPEDEAYQKAALAEIRASKNRGGGGEAAANTHGNQAQYASPVFRDLRTERAKASLREEDIPALRDTEGVLRKQLLTCTEHWQDYLASQPAFAAELSVSTEIGPTWKHTVSWALWMLTRPFSMPKALQVEVKWLHKSDIEQNLRNAKEWVFFALYPSMKQIPAGEWRIYWVRVTTNFAAFYSDQGRKRWIEAAACAARAAAVREGKSAEEQSAAEIQALRKVNAMLSPPRKAPPPPREPSLPSALRPPARTPSNRDRDRNRGARALNPMAMCKDVAMRGSSPSPSRPGPHSTAMSRDATLRSAPRFSSPRPSSAPGSHPSTPQRSLDSGGAERHTSPAPSRRQSGNHSPQIRSSSRGISSLRNDRISRESRESRDKGIAGDPSKAADTRVADTRAADTNGAVDTRVADTRAADTHGASGADVGMST